MTRMKMIPIVAVAGAAVVASSVCAEEPLVTPLTTAFVLCAAMDCEPQLRIPVKARANVNTSSLAVRVAGVRRDNVPDDGFKQVLKATFEGDATAPAAIV